MRARVTAEVMLVTPEQAGEWLGHNKGNRPLGLKTVERYTHFLRSLEWVVNGESVIIDDRDNLLDGQHRLEAVVRGGVPIPMLVVYGVPPEAFATLNTGKTRSLADVLAIGNEPDHRTLAGALRFLHRDLQGKLGARVQSGERASNALLAALLADHAGLRKSVAFATEKCVRGLNPPAMWAFLHYRFSARHPERAERFLDTVLTQRGLVDGTAEMALNNWIKKNADKNRTQEGVIRYLATVIKAWSLALAGRPVKELSWKANEGFPEIV
jgi:hypothetical protein